MSFVFDYFRHQRIGMPECILCEGKDRAVLNKLLTEVIGQKKHPVLLTRLSREGYAALKPAHIKKLNYDSLSRTAFICGTMPKIHSVSVAVVTAGSADLAVACEVCRTLEYLGVESHLFADIGVAGLWRLDKNIEAINCHDVIVVVAGMDAAMVSVLGGLSPRPIVAVPTSVGYGVAQGGVAALHSMLASCAPGIAVVNIDNGYGAACAAFRMINSFVRQGARKK
ncbi:MAG: nickel pincer cofactor biosynthesis protein LarB [Candidatus Omnitrophica bacterium]|nr:nickel pincer cofactor biosynthesis protein LarB [Candidatus Omnitrophota bacterium]MDD5671130.1 nickel pincer cofactor biosynthesis protein LarB [Candidatus Omnitrophota bacterium]